MSAEQEIRGLEERLRQGDASPEPDTGDVFEELLADDVVFVGADGHTLGSKPFVVAAHRPPKKRTFSEVRVSEVMVRELGEVVAVACRTDFTTSERRFGMRTVRLWRKVDGAWKVAMVVMMGPS